MSDRDDALSRENKICDVIPLQTEKLVYQKLA